MTYCIFSCIPKAGLLIQPSNSIWGFLEKHHYKSGWFKLSACYYKAGLNFNTGVKKGNNLLFVNGNFQFQKWYSKVFKKLKISTAKTSCLHLQYSSLNLIVYFVLYGKVWVRNFDSHHFNATKYYVEWKKTIEIPSIFAMYWFLSSSIITRNYQRGGINFSKHCTNAELSESGNIRQCRNTSKNMAYVLTIAERTERDNKKTFLNLIRPPPSSIKQLSLDLETRRSFPSPSTTNVPLNS